MEHLAQWRDRKLVLILGQAAQGKTTLAASFAKRSSKPCAWINLAEEEGEAANLFYLLVHSLGNAFKGIDVTSLLSYPSLSTVSRNEKALYREWARAVFEVFSGPVNIFLDGLDQLPAGAPSLSFVQALIDGMRPGTQMIMLSRAMPSLDILGLRIRGHAAILTNDDLAFSLAETTAFFRQVQGFWLSTPALQRIYVATEGWVGGLVLLSDALMRIPEDDRDRHVTDGIPDRVKLDIFSWLGEEILERQPASLQSFLIRSSILPVVDPAFAGELLKVSNPVSLLQDLAGKNLFVHSTYTEGGGWLFRYHQLFREFLQAKLDSEFTHEEKKELWISAADLYKAKGNLTEALKYYLMAESHAQAASLLEKVGMNLCKEGRTGDLSRGLDALPHEIVRQNPWLILYRCLLRRFTAPKDNIADLQKALDLFEQKGDLGGQLLSLAYLIEATIVLGNDPVPLEDLLEQSRTLLASLRTDLYVRERAELWVQTGFAQILRSGGIREGLLACEKAWLLAKQEGDISLQITSLTNILNGYSFLGDFEKAEEICEGLHLLLEEYALPDLRAVCLINESVLRTLKGQLQRADQLIREAAELIHANGLTYLYPITLLYELFLDPLLGRFREAEDTARRMLDLASSLGSLFLQGLAEMFGGINSYRAGDFDKAGEQIRRARRILDSNEARSTFHVDWSLVLEALVALHTGAEFEIASLQGGSNVPRRTETICTCPQPTSLQPCWKREPSGGPK
jgi:ATP/maltotriose-dependent transcriptional regulator MalT